MADTTPVPPPLVSVLMPTYRHAAFIERAIGSLLDQVLVDWELVIVDDGSPDDTTSVLEPYLSDQRIRYLRLSQNGGLGGALNLATGQARGRYLAYLPSDDAYYPAHLSTLTAVLEDRPEVWLAYGGVHWGDDLWRGWTHHQPTLHGGSAVGAEAQALADPCGPMAPPNGNLLALVQVLHRRDLETELPWPTRQEIVSDTLERDQWVAMLERGAVFAYAGSVTCEWSSHPDQRHRIIGGSDDSRYGGRAGRGMHAYREYYHVPLDAPLNWQPSSTRGKGNATLNDDLISSRPKTVARRSILVVGDLGFNPERMYALEDRGYELYGLWMPPDAWTAAGRERPRVGEDLALGPGWQDRVRAVKPDLIYALLNWHALPTISKIVEAGLRIPLVFHFKEGPHFARQRGLWPQLRSIMLAAHGVVLINDLCMEWFESSLDRRFRREQTLIMDGDLPHSSSLGGSWSRKLSEDDGQVHTVCAGRWQCTTPLSFESLSQSGVHFHFYGESFRRWPRSWAERAPASPFLHVHQMVAPSEWAREFSRYDAGWMHVFDSKNEGDVERADWSDLNLPARLSTYAHAGLPWILKETGNSRVAVRDVADRVDAGVVFKDEDDLVEKLLDRRKLQRLSSNVIAARHEFTFEDRLDDLCGLFERVAAQGPGGPTAVPDVRRGFQRESTRPRK